MKKEGSTIKKFMTWLIMLSVLLLLVVGLLYLNRRSNCQPLEQQKEEQQEGKQEDITEEPEVEIQEQVPEISTDKIRAFTPELTDEFYIMEIFM